MANTFITVKEIARETLIRLRANEVMAGLVNRDFQNEFSDRGDTIQARVPVNLVANDFTTTISPQDISEQSVDIKLDQIADTSVALTAKERTLNIEDFSFQVIEPAATALAAKIDSKLMELYKDIPYWSGTSGTTPATLASLANTRMCLNKNKVPNGSRRLVIDPEAGASLLSLDSLVEVDKAGMDEALREAMLGRLYGFEIAETQNILTHTAGLYSILADVTAVGAAAATSVVLTSAGGASTDTLLRGDLLTIGGNQHVVTADTAAAIAGAVTASIYPAVPTGAYAGAAVVFPDQTATAHTPNLAFHRNAITLAIRPLVLPSDKEAYVTSFDGISIRVTEGYDMDTKKDTISFDVLYGMKVTQPELACRLLG